MINVTLDTSCIVSLLNMVDENISDADYQALLKIRDLHLENVIKIWVSQKSINESILNIDNFRNYSAQNKKWINTLTYLEEFETVESRWVLGFSRLGEDTVLGDEGNADDWEIFKKILTGNKKNLKTGDLFDITIVFEHYLQGNDYFCHRDRKMFRSSVNKALKKEFGINVVTPEELVSILQTKGK